MTTVSVIGGGSTQVTIHGNGSVYAGNGNDSITVTGNGRIQVGHGADTLALLGGGNGIVQEYGWQGNDTITLGQGNDTVWEQGHATVQGSFGGAQLNEGIVDFFGQGHDIQAQTGHSTLIGGSSTNEFIGGLAHSNVQMIGGTGNDTFIGGAGQDTMTGGKGSNLFEFLSEDKGGAHVITNFVSGQDQLYLEGHSLSWLQQHGEIKSSGGNTYISLDGGKTTIELENVAKLSSTDITTHKG